MKRPISLLLCGILLFGLSGCAAAAGSRPAGALPRAAYQAASETGDSEPAEVQSLKLLLPSTEEALAGILQQMAAAQGIGLEVETAVYGDRYAAAVEEALAGDAPPDMLWVNREADLPGAELLDLSGPNATPTMRALAALVPEGASALSGDEVRGLPLGSSSVGYLVNLDLLCALLDTRDVTSLRANLADCSWQQWETLAATIEQYLDDPQKTQVEIGNASYTLPRGRAALAQPLRGIFAVADDGDEAFVAYGLEAAVTAAFENEAQLLQTDAATRAQRLRPALEALLAALGLETAHMARKTGVLSRGERYNMSPKANKAAAIQLFLDKTALFLRADSQLAATLQAENPALEGHLLLLPFKMPSLPADEAEEEADDSAGSQAAAAESETEEDAPAEVPGVDLSAQIAASNHTLLHGSGGVLCIPAASPNAEAAQNLLLRLFTSDEGRKAIAEELQLWPFTSPVPMDALQAQTAAAVAAGAGQLVPWPTNLAAAKQNIAAYVGENLMGESSWGAEARAAFVNAALGAMGMPQRDAEPVQEEG